MNDQLILSTFMAAAESWTCEDYYLDIRYIANTSQDGDEICDVVVSLGPMPHNANMQFSLDLEGLRVGQIQRVNVSKSEITLLLSEIASGIVSANGRKLRLLPAESLMFYSEMMQRDRWYSDLHLQVTSSRRPSPNPLQLAALDNELRQSTPPFDGLRDVCSWLGMNSEGALTHPPSISVRILPPAELIISKCSLSGNVLTLELNAHRKFDIDRLVLSIRAFPGAGLNDRLQISNKIKWRISKSDLNVGTVKIKLKNADSVLTMLLIEGHLVRRQWFIDPQKARNNRLVATQHYDNDLRMVRHSLLEDSRSEKFEQGVAALFFLNGCNPVTILETDAPDILVMTPLGRLIIVECTTRIADFSSKLGKLVDRRGSLDKHFVSTGHSLRVEAMLVCRLPRDQIAAHEQELRNHRVILFAKEQLVSAIDGVRTPSDPDALLDSALKELATTFPK
jgi:hypothetical protein